MSIYLHSFCSFALVSFSSFCLTDELYLVGIFASLLSRMRCSGRSLTMLSRCSKPCGGSQGGLLQPEVGRFCVRAWEIRTFGQNQYVVAQSKLVVGKCKSIAKVKGQCAEQGWYWQSVPCVILRFGKTPRIRKVRPGTCACLVSPSTSVASMTALLCGYQPPLPSENLTFLMTTPSRQQYLKVRHIA